MSSRAQIAVMAASTLVLWIAVGFVLVYDHGVEQANPALTPLERRQHAEMLYGIAAAFVVFNAVVTVARIRQVVRAESRAGTLRHR